MKLGLGLARLLKSRHLNYWSQVCMLFLLMSVCFIPFVIHTVNHLSFTTKKNIPPLVN